MNLVELPKMPTDCYLTNDLDVEFISTLAKDLIQPKTKGLVHSIHTFISLFWGSKYKLLKR